MEAWLALASLALATSQSTPGLIVFGTEFICSQGSLRNRYHAIGHNVMRGLAPQKCKAKHPALAAVSTRQAHT